MVKSTENRMRSNLEGCRTFRNQVVPYLDRDVEETRIPFIFDDFHFCRSKVIGLDMTENRIFTLYRMIT
jgi:hypothetical protein